MDAALKARAAASADKAVALLQELIALQRHGEAAVQARFAAACEACGATVVRHRYLPSDVKPREEFAAGIAIDLDMREAVVARFAGTGGGRSMLVFAHPDGEPFQPQHGWRHDPFGGAIENGRLYGWG
ncbi:MAG: hypothetical protein ACK5U4_21060, partial [Rhodospirillales bacterium]